MTRPVVTIGGSHPGKTALMLQSSYLTAMREAVARSSDLEETRKAVDAAFRPIIEKVMEDCGMDPSAVLVWSAEGGKVSARIVPANELYEPASPEQTAP